MGFRNNKVWIATDPDGVPAVRDGKVLVKYQLDQPHEYWVHEKSVRPLEPPGETADVRVETTPPPAPTAKKSACPPHHAATEADSENAICIYTDGASSGNPGPSGIGIVMRYGAREKEISRFIGMGTNNIAELEAIRVGLDEVKNRRLPVRVFTDSRYAIGLLSQGWNARTNTDLVKAIRQTMQTFSNLEFIKIPGHAGHPENERADRLAVAAVKKGR